MKGGRKRIFLIAIPHFNWKLLNLLIESGKFKNFKKLVQEGSSGEIVPQQTLCSTPVEFTSIITGVKKEKHSIGYGKYSDQEYVDGGRIYSRLDIKTKSVWEVALEHGKRVGIYNWLLTWPPKKINGFMVAGRPSQNENTTYPPELKEILQEEFSAEPDFFNTNAALMLIKKYDIDLFLGMEERAHGPIHAFWDSVEFNKEELKEERERFFNCFEEVDSFLGKIQEEFPDATIMMVSDSGMRIREYPIYTLGNETIELSKKLNIGIQFYATDVYPQHLPKASPTFHLPGKTQEEKERIKNILSKVKYKNGEPFIKNIVWKDDDLSFCFNFQPSFVGDKCDWLTLVLPNGEEFKMWVTKQMGVSFPEGGVFVAKGPSIKKNFNIGKVDVTDIAPTVLYLLGLPVPDYMDGKILGEIMA
jgi:predicted AlkP superfamily phosphohydrolase/phosphomutase